jgi:thiol:disulfide interchange protein DsbA
MNRALTLAAALAAATIAGTFSLKACARAPESAAVAASPPVAQPQTPATPAPAAALGKWQAGTNYTLVSTPQPTTVAKGNVEVLEVFWYGCGHCYALDPVLESWRTNKPAYVEFARVPVVWGAPQRQHAKLFYTLKALNRMDLHSAVFDAIHLAGNPLAAPTDEGARAAQLAFLKAHGVSEKDFDAAYDSMSVATNLRRAEDIGFKYQVASVPLMLVNGKYTTSVAQAGGASELIAILNDLAASEKSR